MRMLLLFVTLVLGVLCACPYVPVASQLLPPVRCVTLTSQSHCEAQSSAEHQRCVWCVGGPAAIGKDNKEKAPDMCIPSDVAQRISIDVFRCTSWDPTFHQPTHPVVTPPWEDYVANPADMAAAVQEPVQSQGGDDPNTQPSQYTVCRNKYCYNMFDPTAWVQCKACELLPRHPGY